MSALLLALVVGGADLYRRDMSRSALQVFGPNAPVATLAGQIHQESAWRADARSWVGAQGLAQFMPATARDMEQRFPSECAPANPYSPAWAFRCRDRYMASLHRLAAVRTGATECDRWTFALRAYNGGGGWVQRDRQLAERNGEDSTRWRVVERYNAGRSAANFKENTEYPHRIYKLERRYAQWGRRLACLD